MRIRAVVAFALLLLPAGLSAQRIPLPKIGRRDPARPQPLPPQAGPIANALAYKRWRLSVESYPLISFVQSPGFTDGRQSSWTTFGSGTRADYRLTSHLSATLDLTSSFLGGPAVTQTAELGARLRPERSDRRVYPFVDFRVGYLSAFSRSSVMFLDDGFGSPPMPGTRGSRYSNGFGAIAGVGMEYALTRRFSLTTAGTVTQHRLTAQALQNGLERDRHFSMTWYRYTLGIAFNPITLIRPSAASVP